MINDLEINNLINKKTDNLAHINDQLKRLQELDDTIAVSKFQRWFGSGYLWIKRYLLLAVAMIFIILAGVLFIAPKLVTDYNSDLKSTNIEEAKNYYYKTWGMTLQEAITRSFKENDFVDLNTILQNWDEAMTHTVSEEWNEAIRLLALILIPMALVLLYMVRMTNKLQQRNKKLNQAESLTQKLINDYKLMLQNEVDEINQLKNMVTGN